MGQVSYVVPPGTPGVIPSSPFNSWATAATNIQEAVNAAAGQGWTNVWVSNGTYTLTSQVEIAAAMTVRSWHDGALDRAGTIVDGNYPAVTNRCFYINHTSAVVQGFTITNGYITVYPGVGGGVYLANGLLHDCIVGGNHAGFDNTVSGFGGGVYALGGCVSNCSIVNNTVVTNGTLGHYGGGIYALNDALISDTVISSNIGRLSGGFYLEDNAVMRRCVIVGNELAVASTTYGGGGGRLRDNAILEDSEIRANYSAGEGGGVHLSDNSIMRRCLVMANQAASTSYGGGGIYIYFGNPTLENCRIVHNTNAPGYAGGVAVRWTSSNPTVPAIRNCLIAFNTGANAGGVYLYDAPGEIVNCTIVSNKATSTYVSGGVFFSGSTAAVHNSIIYQNLGHATYPQWNNYRVLGANVPAISHSCAVPAADAYGAGNTTNDPLFISSDPGNYNFRLPAVSPCVNTGIEAAWMAGALDLDGKARLDRFSGLVDMGCYEYVAPGTMLSIK